MHVVFSILWLYVSGVFLIASLGSQSISIHGETQFNHGRGHYGMSYDSTQGVPNYVFVGFWIIIILFFIRLGWEYRDELFKKKE